MACEDIEQLLVSEAGRLGPELYRRSLDTSIWLKLMKQETWPDEMGDIVSVLTYERTLPRSAVTFADYRQNNQDRVIGQSFVDVDADGVSDHAVTNGGSCVIAAQKLTIGQTLRQYNLQKAAIESPDLCLEDLRFPVRRKEQLSNIVDIMNDVTAYVWKERYRDEYMRISKNHVVVRKNLPRSTTMPATAATSKLTQGVLDHLYMELVRNGGGANPMDRNEGAPVFMLSCSAETSRSLIKNNADIRQDFRYSDRKNELLTPMGINRPYAGFYHAIEDFAPRYDFNGATWTRRAPYVFDPTTKGDSLEINPDYEAAEYEDSIIFHVDTAHSVVPAPIGGLPAGMMFDPQSYRGDFRWRNIPDRTCNPDGNIGFYRAIFANGTKPVYPQYGFVIRHLRCPLDLGLVDCNDTAVTLGS